MFQGKVIEDIQTHNSLSINFQLSCAPALKIETLVEVVKIRVKSVVKWKIT